MLRVLLHRVREKEKRVHIGVTQEAVVRSWAASLCPEHSRQPHCNLASLGRTWRLRMEEVVKESRMKTGKKRGDETLHSSA
jgi:hypothetical protein